METLFNDSEVFQKERPKKLSANQLSEFCAKKAREIKTNSWSDSDEDDITSDLKKLCPFWESGYEMAKDLEGTYYDAYYNIDSSFIEFLEHLESDYKNLLNENVKSWVKAHKPQPKFQVGQKLLIVEKLCFSMKKGMIVYVNSIWEEVAKYVIDADPNSNGGTLLEYERVEKCCVLH